MKLVQLFTVLHNLEIASKFAGGYHAGWCHKSIQVGVIRACRLVSVSKDLFFDVFIFKQKNACSQMYVDPNSVKNFAESFSSLETNCQTMACRSQAVNLT